MNQMFLTTGIEGAAQFLTVLLVFILVLVLTFFTTKWLGQYQKAQVANKNFEIIETCRITPNKYLQIVKVGKKYLVIAIGKDSISMLTEIDEEELDLENSHKPLLSQDSFKKTFEKAKDVIYKRGDNK